MPAYLLGVPWEELEELMGEVLEALRKHGAGSASLDPLQVVIATKKELSEEDIEEIRRLLSEKYSELARRIILLRVWP